MFEQFYASVDSCVTSCLCRSDAFSKKLRELNGRQDNQFFRCVHQPITDQSSKSISIKCWASSCFKSFSANQKSEPDGTLVCFWMVLNNNNTTLLMPFVSIFFFQCFSFFLSFFLYPSCVLMCSQEQICWDYLWSLHRLLPNPHLSQIRRERERQTEREG